MKEHSFDKYEMSFAGGFYRLCHLFINIHDNHFLRKQESAQPFDLVQSTTTTTTKIIVCQIDVIVVHGKTLNFFLLSENQKPTSLQDSYTDL